MPKEKEKQVTVRVPVSLWRRVKLLHFNGRVRSFNAAVVEALDLFLEVMEDEERRRWVDWDQAGTGGIPHRKWKITCVWTYISCTDEDF